MFCRSGSVQSVETVGNSEGTATTETSQTPSCRALAGTRGRIKIRGRG